ncbi:GLPGLI family protein [Neotamlana laminarinivorans]|uniref:GLPGLI family protein n=1 Tax=Neotamlana laminarinivorans TaxID=2883124 RepID=A0A9X1I133_9FLAO|nr:GLPGLI family protein [Tamlana laminarinivorans]MCB4798054.1 GLPGLI family protein [Tamlana laminarinivorans]
MKKIIISCLLVTAFCNAQNISNGTITYIVSQKKDHVEQLKEKAKTSESAQRVLDLYEMAEDVTAILHFTAQEAIYKAQESLKNEADKTIVNFTYPMAGGRTIYYNNTIENINASDVSGEYIRVIQEKQEWQLVNETKQIGKYTCFKAIQTNSNRSKVKPIAWYTLDIPLPFGPKGFNGLPGLILEIEEKVYVFKATKIELNSTDFEPIEQPTKGKKITYAEWRERTKNFFTK